MDFTLTIYKSLLEQFLMAGYKFQSITKFLKGTKGKVILLRHDVDNRKLNSLKFAQIQDNLNIFGTYYFRMVPQSYDEEIIKKIASMGHEIGYHYETMDKANGDIEKAYDLFCRELEELRALVPIKTICMHGSPLSKYDNRDLWKYYDYRKLNVTSEPYFDIDFSKIFYLTDTGRRWDGKSASIRDKTWIADPKEFKVSVKTKKKNRRFQNISFHSTEDIIQSIKGKNLPHKIMITFHPQRWTNNPVLWTQELVMQNLKNLVKIGLNKFRKV